MEVWNDVWGGPPVRYLNGCIEVRGGPPVPGPLPTRGGALISELNRHIKVFPPHLGGGPGTGGPPLISIPLRHPPVPASAMQGAHGGFLRR